MTVQDLFRCEVAYDGSWVVALFGELDIATAPISVNNSQVALTLT
jgi:hypothetical protein